MSRKPVPADIWSTDEFQNVMHNKYVLFIGDSVIRAMYKDFVKFLQKNEHLTDHQLKVKGEHTFEGDRLMEGGMKGQLVNDPSYKEIREYKTPYHLVRFIFITRIYSDYIKSVCTLLANDNEKPDVVLINSGCWDLTRYGPNSIPEFKHNLNTGLVELLKVLPNTCLFIWLSTMPLSKDVKGGFMVPEAEQYKSKLREDILEANHFTFRVVDELKLDFIDLHHLFVNQIQRRAADGIHWDATAHRRITNILITHICRAWQISIPNRIIDENFTAVGESNDGGFQTTADYDFSNNRWMSNRNGLPKELQANINEIKSRHKGYQQNNNNNNINNNNFNNNNNAAILDNYMSNIVQEAIGVTNNNMMNMMMNQQQQMNMGGGNFDDYGGGNNFYGQYDNFQQPQPLINHKKRKRSRTNSKLAAPPNKKSHKQGQ